MFDLEVAIADWRQAYWRQAYELRWTDDLAALDELEDHLREDFAALVQRGLIGPEAWRAATAKLGDSNIVCREFAKIDPLPLADRAMLALIFGGVGLVVLGLTAVAVWKPVELLSDPLLATHMVTITLAYLAGLSAAAAAGYVGIRRFLVRRTLPPLTTAALKLVRVSSLLAAILTAVGFAFGALWAHGQDHRIVDVGSLREMGAIAVVVCFLVVAMSTWAPAVSDRVTLAISILGGGTILLGWFGPFANVSVLLPVIGFGGFAASLVVAALSLKTRDDRGVAS